MSTGGGGVFEEEGGGLGGDAFAAAGEAEPLGGGSFDRDSVDVYADSAAIRAGAAPQKTNFIPWARTLVPLAACF